MIERSLKMLHVALESSFSPHFVKGRLGEISRDCGDCSGFMNDLLGATRAEGIARERKAVE